MGFAPCMPATWRVWWRTEWAARCLQQLSVRVSTSVTIPMSCSGGERPTAQDTAATASSEGPLCRQHASSQQQVVAARPRGSPVHVQGSPVAGIIWITFIVYGSLHTDLPICAAGHSLGGKVVLQYLRDANEAGRGFPAPQQVRRTLCTVHDEPANVGQAGSSCMRRADPRHGPAPAPPSLGRPALSK